MLVLPFRPGAGDLGFPLLCEKFHERNQKKENPVATHLHEVLEPSLSGGLPSSVDRKKPGKMGLSSHLGPDATFAPFSSPYQGPVWGPLSSHLRTRLPGAFSQKDGPGKALSGNRDLFHEIQGKG